MSLESSERGHQNFQGCGQRFPAGCHRAGQGGEKRSAEPGGGDVQRKVTGCSAEDVTRTFATDVTGFARMSPAAPAPDSEEVRAPRGPRTLLFRPRSGNDEPVWTSRHSSAA